MRTEAASAGFYKSPWGAHPKLQIVTVAELLEGRRLDAPPSRQTSVTYKQARRAQKVAEEQTEFNLEPSNPLKKSKMAKATLPDLRSLKARKPKRRA